ncbi:amiloride-sensitive sodium channel subunit beta-like [Mercenaria mercenaria]|uniref:amiloride-sensitive sodium channel subunit beta-like n=1 Tax=Mercenaria mercenaria TaxID=6596 RepID=UPI00234F2B45|nr:amiloride-sensitive sodium channel subunit beta-like [Mercenaria mercenaria]
MMDVEFYRGARNDHPKSRNSSHRYYDLGGAEPTAETEDMSRYIFYNGFKNTNTHMNAEQDRKHDEIPHNKSHDTTKEFASIQSSDSSRKHKTFRRIIARFAEKTSMQGVPYINNAKLWWAKLIWSFMLLVAIAAMSLHLWYLVDQYTDWPVQTKISLGFETLKFPKVTICNTNAIHRGRLNRYNEAEDLKDLVEDLKPENLVPDQFDENYDPYASKPPDNDQPGGGPSPTNQGQGNVPDGKSDGGTVPPDGPPSQNGSPGSQKTPRRGKRFVKQYKNFNKTRYDERERPNFRDVKPQEDDDYDGRVDSKTAIEDLFSGMYMDIDKTDRAQLGHNITDMLVSCTFNGRECSTNMFTLHQTLEYGNCWSISSDKFNVKTSGPSGGLSLVFYLEVTEYLKGITTGYGARMQIHEQRTYPFPAEEGLYIPASMETDIGLRMISITRQSGLYGDCDDGTAFQKSTTFKYTRSACQSFCVISKVMERCNCFSQKSEEFAGSKDSQLRPCRSREELLCMVNIEKEFGAEKFSCNCNNPCNEIQYLKSVSQRQWPGDDYAMVLLQEVCDRDPDDCATIREFLGDPAKIRNNFMKLNIYYEDLNYENITEIPEIEIQQFLSDVGGAIGLWIGLSILSLCELVQLFVELCDYGIHKTVKSGRHDRKKRRASRKGLDNATGRSFASKDNNSCASKLSRSKADVVGNDFYLPPGQRCDMYTDHSHPGSDTVYDKPYN